MFQLGKTIVSEDIIKKDFLCNLSACKGACCIDGDAGAPLEAGEVEILKEIYPKVKPFLRQEGIDAICGDALKPAITGDENIVCFNLILHHLVGATETQTYKMQGDVLFVWHSTNTTTQI